MYHPTITKSGFPLTVNAIFIFFATIRKKIASFTLALFCALWSTLERINRNTSSWNSIKILEKIAKYTCFLVFRMNKIQPPSATLFSYPFAIVAKHERMAVFKMNNIFFITIFLQTRQHQTQKLRRTVLSEVKYLVV